MESQHLLLDTKTSAPEFILRGVGKRTGSGAAVTFPEIAVFALTVGAGLGVVVSHDGVGLVEVSYCDTVP